MMFLSRVVEDSQSPEGLYGVVDTDDGIEEFIRGGELYDVVCKLGVDIAGVDTSGKLFITSVNPYQLPKYTTAAQAKYAVLGCQVTLYKDIITRIRWSRDVTVKLSDLGRSCSGFVLDGGQGVVTLVLDDNVTFSMQSFVSSMGDYGLIETGHVKFDIRNLTVGVDTLMSIFRDSGLSWKNSVIDGRK